jgi:hypothetical protein
MKIIKIYELPIQPENCESEALLHLAAIHGEQIHPVRQIRQRQSEAVAHRRFP